MRVLVTGGAGYIGSHAVRRLAKRGHEVLVLDNLSNGHRFSVEEFELVVADIADVDVLSRILPTVDAVMHFAAYAYVAESVRDPRKYFDNNVRSGLSLLNAVIEHKTRYFILSSTCAVYGVPSQIPISEKAPRAPINPYGASKLALEHALEAYHEAYGLQFASLRYFNAAGADESSNIGELHVPETHVIPCALEAAAGLRTRFEIYGTDYATADGTCVRDYIHVNDLADAHILALEYLAAGEKAGAFNLGTGRGHSILDVVSTVERVTGLPLSTHFGPRRPGDPPVLVADPQRAMEQLHWKPTRSLQDIVATAWNWMQSDRMKELDHSLRASSMRE